MNHSTKENVDSIVAFCEANIDEMNLHNNIDNKLLSYASLYLMKNLGNLNENDGMFLTKYLARVCARRLGIEENVEIEILEQTVFDEKSKECMQNLDSPMRAWHKYDIETQTSKVTYSTNYVAKQLTSRKTKDIIDALITIGHELAHAYQDTFIFGNGKFETLDREKYIMTLEKLTDVMNKEFYQKNYANLYIENQAEDYGLMFTEYILKLFRKDILQSWEGRINQLHDNCKKRMADNDIIPDTEREARISLYFTPRIMKIHPILGIAFDENGRKKDIITLLQERRQSLEARQ